MRLHFTATASNTVVDVRDLAFPPRCAASFADGFNSVRPPAREFYPRTDCRS